MISTRTIGRTSRNTLAFVVAAAFVSTAAPAFASDPKTPKPQESPKPAKETLYCAKATPTGTLIKRQVCKTRERWIANDGFDPLAEKNK